MKTRIENPFLLTKEQVKDTITRVKMLFINAKGEILLGFSDRTYQFPGGHVEEGETLSNAMSREIKEETGITLSITAEPFLKLVHYIKDDPWLKDAMCYEIYYYCLFLDEEYHLDLTDYTLEEKLGNFQLKYVPLDQVGDLLTSSIPLNPSINQYVVKEMLLALLEFSQLEFDY